MILFSPAKINVGLHILSRRGDGFHDLQSVMVPFDLCDILEINHSAAVSSLSQPFRMEMSGIPVEGAWEENLCHRAWLIFTEKVPLPPLRTHLHKQIPPGAGLGGGSSNGTTMLMGLNRLADYPLGMKELESMAASLGSDCPFFLCNRPMRAEGRGEILRELSSKPAPLHMVVLFPGIHISTAEAFSQVVPERRTVDLGEQILKPPGQWEDLVTNDFEPFLFRKYPLLQKLKEKLLRSGALYASVTGSGSAIYGLFSSPPALPEELEDFFLWKGTVFNPA